MTRNRSRGDDQAETPCRARISRRTFVGAGLALLLASAIPNRAAAAPEAMSVAAPDGSPDELYPAPHLPFTPPQQARPRGVLEIPYYSQLDGTPRASSNCGPASLAMLLTHFGDMTAIADLRWNINQFMGDWRVDNGSSWDALAHAVQMRPFEVVGLYQQKGNYRRWTTEDLRAETEQGRAVMILTRYPLLPGHETSRFRGNHYVVVVGFDDSGSVVYHDPAYLDALEGAYRTMSPEQLDQTWSKVSSSIAYSGMSIRPKA